MDPRTRHWSPGLLAAIAVILIAVLVGVLLLRAEAVFSLPW